MRATFVPAQRTPLTMVDALHAFRIAYERLEGVAPSPECLALLVAQSDFETAGWKEMFCYNLLNAKAGPTYEGFYCQYPCGEVDPKTGKETKYKPPHPQCNFRAYQTAPDGAVAALALLRSLWPRAWQSAKQGDVEAFCTDLVTERGKDPQKRDGGEFFTANLPHYIRGVRARLRRVQAAIVQTPEVVGGLTGELMDAWDPKTRRA